MSDPLEEKSANKELVEANAADASVAPLSALPPSTEAASASASVSASSWHAFKLLLNANWLKNTARLCLAFIPQCIFPATLMTVAGLSITFGFHGCIAQLKQQAIQLPNLIFALGMMFAMSVVCIVCMIWGFTVWLVRLNTFGHAFCLTDVTNGRILPHASAPDVQSESLTADSMRALFKASHTYVLSRKKYLARFYLLVSMVALVPAFIWMALCTVKMFTVQSPSPLLMKMSLPPLVDFGVITALVLLSAYLIGLSWISVVISSMSKAGANQAAWDCIRLSMARFLPMIFLALITGFIGVAISTPQIIVDPSSAFANDMMSENLTTSVVGQVWQGLSSVVLLTFSLTPFCELMRDKLQ